MWILMMMGWLTVAPLGILGLYARRLIAAGYNLDDGRLALEDDRERRLEEIRFEYGKGLTWVDRTLRFLGVGGILTAVGSVVVGVLGGIDLSIPAILGGDIGVVSAFAAALRNKRRRDWIGEAARWMVEGPLGSVSFALGRLGLDRVALGAGAHRPTEMAISIAADRLFEELPREYRRELKGLPAAIQRLEADARSMRLQVERLERAMAEVGDERGGVGSEERAALRMDLVRTRDEARGRLTDAISALEKIRLGLLRLHAGDGTVESLTLELGSANQLSRAIDALLEGQKDVARLMRPPELRTDP
ncbi:MAG: hypothetical protein FJX74_25110 [Armatimonadetes bacterium]|nr:hypothetical protein [Armatimonadota bacterium]